MILSLPQGFKANAVASGIKKFNRPDLALIFSQKPAKAAGLFTKNKITSYSVKASAKLLRQHSGFHGIIVNSGNANCFNGKSGLNRTYRVLKDVARLLDIKEENLLIASTGIIGKVLPGEKIKKAAPLLVKGLNPRGLLKAAKAIQTTDTRVKISSARLKIKNKAITICGFAKGAGMIAPDLDYVKIGARATMLSFLLTDANINQAALDAALKYAVDNSFNCITVDGCMSTNDTVLMLANCTAANPLIRENDAYFERFSQQLKYVCLNLAKMIIKDAEGATKFIEIRVRQARSVEEARRTALAIANSNLFKTAAYGKNRNLGRIVAAIGSSGVDAKEGNLKIKVSPLIRKDIYVVVELNRGKCEAVIYTSDLTPEYVKINARYS